MGFQYMGQTYSTYEGVRRAEAADRKRQETDAVAVEKAEKAALDASLDALSRKLVMVMVDQVNAAIVRPGPKPEERECYEMAQELHDHKPTLEALVRAVLAQHGVRQQAGSEVAS